MAENETRLVRTPRNRLSSSLEVMLVSVFTAEPLKMPSVVSKSLPCVVTTTVPDAGAFQDHQTECPPETRATFGSPASGEAPTLNPSTLALVPVNTVAAAKLSFAGGELGPPPEPPDPPVPPPLPKLVALAISAISRLLIGLPRPVTKS